MAASCESSRRRRASPHSRYSGSDSTSSATNMVSRSLEAGNSIMPPTANSVSGKISVCMLPAARPSRSSGLPGVAAACAANGLSLVSAMSSTLTKASTSMVPWMNSVGRSTATAPIAATWPGLPLAYSCACEATTIVRMNAAASEPSASTRCTARRAGRGVNASTSTPATAAPKTTSIGESCPNSMLGARDGAGHAGQGDMRRGGGQDTGHGAVPFCACGQLMMPLPRDGPVSDRSCAPAPSSP